jgi:hypothetical protein
MRRLFIAASALALVIGLMPTFEASAQQSVNLFIGGFAPQDLDSRDPNDVLFKNSGFLATDPFSPAFDVGKFNGVTVGGEWLAAIGRYAEAGLGVSFYQQTVPTVDALSTYPDGALIAQELQLRVIPFSAIFRFLPLGNRQPLQPYVGGGANIYAWKYSETGDFVDSDGFIFTDRFVGSGGAVGPVVVGGVRFGVGRSAIGGEVRWQGGSATLPREEFGNSKIDLGGITYLVSFKIPF